MFENAKRELEKKRQEEEEESPLEDVWECLKCHAYNLLKLDHTSHSICGKCSTRNDEVFDLTWDTNISKLNGSKQNNVKKSYSITFKKRCQGCGTMYSKE